jgi:glutamyl-tRNA reductase
VIALVGISHKTAPVEVRERLAFTSEELLLLLPGLRQRFGPTVVLSTCNRTEVYLDGAAPDLGFREVVAHLVADRQTGISAVDEQFYSLEGLDAVRHLYRVAAGLESMVLGESQILGQVRDALHTAQKAGVVDTLLERLFQSALSAGRRIRAGAGIAGAAASVSSAAVELARRSLGDLSDRNVLIVSAGEAAKLTAWSMSRSGAGRIVIAGRTLSRAAKLADSLGAVAVPMHELRHSLASADVVVSSTGSREIRINKDMVANAMQSRPERPMLMIDLAVPRDIDPAVREIQGVALHDIDSVQPLIGSGLEVDLGRDAEGVESAVDDESARFMDWWHSRWLAPTIAALQDRAEAIRRAETAKTFGRLPNLSAEERQRIDALTSAIVKKMLHEPIMCLKESDSQPAYLEAIRDLFALHVAPP